MFETTADYPVTLHDSLNAIRDGLPPSQTINIEDVLNYQGGVSSSMAEQLESLTRHLSVMEVAVEDEITEDDFQGSYMFPIRKESKC